MYKRCFDPCLTNRVQSRNTSWDFIYSCKIALCKPEKLFNIKFINKSLLLIWFLLQIEIVNDM